MTFATGGDKSSIPFNVNGRIRTIDIRWTGTDLTEIVGRKFIPVN
jgi:hypothetical protein